MKLNDRNVKDGSDEHLTGEPEMIKAFRDTWELGIHSYLTYLRDRLLIARELLTESGSCFVQISDENVHLVRCLMDEVFGSENFIGDLFYQKTSGAGSPGELTSPPTVGDYIIWYSKTKSELKFRHLYVQKVFGGEGSSGYKNIELADGTRMSIADYEKETTEDFNYQNKPKGSKLYTLGDLTSQAGSENARFPIDFNGKVYSISKGSWKTSVDGIKRLKELKRIDVSSRSNIGYIRYFDDFPYMPKRLIRTDSVINKGQTSRNQAWMTGDYGSTCY